MRIMIEVDAEKTQELCEKLRLYGDSLVSMIEREVNDWIVAQLDDDGGDDG